MPYASQKDLDIYHLPTSKSSSVTTFTEPTIVFSKEDRDTTNLDTQAKYS